MIINFIEQPEAFPDQKIDYFICSSGFESRSTYAFTMYKDLVMHSNKICFQFVDRKVKSRLSNDIFFEENSFKFYQANSQSIEDYLILFNEIFKDEKEKSICIAFDFSCMTTLIYASVLKFFYSHTSSFVDVSLLFIYTQSLFSAPPISKSLAFNNPISIFDTLQTTNNNIALIIGLGYDKDVALGLYEYFQNDKNDIYLFITDESNENKFHESVVNNNAELIELVDKNNIVYYNISNILHLVSTLDSLVNYLIANNFRVVIAPTGPKQFSLIALIINLFHKEVTTYRLSHGQKADAIDKIPDTSRKNVITHINFKSV